MDAPPVEADVAECSSSAAPGVPPSPAAPSKKQLKKLQRRQATLDRKAERKQNHKKEVEERRKLREESAEGQDNRTPEEKEAARRAREAKKQRVTAGFAKAVERGGWKVCIDLGMDEYMTDSELRSLVTQVIYCIGSNRKAEQPCMLTLAGEQPGFEERLAKNAGHDQWLGLRRTTSSFNEAFPEGTNLVYLTADSPHVLEAMSPGTVYIIGGIVDRNRHKNLTQQRAADVGIATARLPLEAICTLNSSRVLAVNHVFAMLLAAFATCGRFGAETAAVVPPRKRAREEEGDAEEGKEAAGDERPPAVESDEVTAN